jgi:PEP-CTERM motif
MKSTIATFILFGSALVADFAVSDASAQSITISGGVTTPGSLNLSTLPSTTQTDTYFSGSGPVTDTFTGPTLWGILQTSGIITNPSIHNDILSKYVIVTGANGTQSVVSAGEISPSFGNHQDLVAIQDTSGNLPGSDGIARMTAPGDNHGDRYVGQVTSLTVASAPVRPGTNGGPTTSFAVGGLVSQPGTYNLSTLQGFPARTETVTYLSGGTPVTDTYTGVLLWDLLTNILIDPSNILRDLVSVTGSDGYEVVLSLAEIDPIFGNDPVLVAYSDTAGQLAGGAGFARLVVPFDIAGGRYVSNIADLSVFDGVSAVPEPSTWAMMLLGFAGLGFAFRQSRREVSSA